MKCEKFNIILNRRIVVGGVVGIFAIIIAIVGFGGIIDDVSGGSLISPSPSETPTIQSLVLELEDITIVEIVDNTAYMGITFKITNPNHKSVLLQMIKYTVYADDIKIGSKSICDRDTDVGIAGSSNYFIILNDRPTSIKSEFTIKNAGNNPEFWEAMHNNTINWRIEAEAFYNLSSMTAGGELDTFFEFEYKE
jgi:LEA14-like dessication related protein